jgi:tetratricopeptide (TPR) repeat protein
LRAQAAAAAAAGRIDIEAKAWNRVAVLLPRDVEARVRLSSTYRRLGWGSLARAAARQALALAPSDPDALRSMAIVEFSEQDFEEAIRFARALLARVPSDGAAYSIVARCRREQGRWNEALAAAEAAVLADPVATSYHIDMARIYLDRANSPDAARAAQIVAAAPAATREDRLLKGYWAGLCFERMGETDRAIAALGGVYREDPEYEEVAYHLARLHQRKGDAAGGAEFLKRYQSALARRTKLRDAEAALDLDMNSPEAHLRVARAAHELGDTGRAVMECRAALRLEPGHAAARTLLKELEGRLEGGADG